MKDEYSELRAAFHAGARIQAWTLREFAKSSNDGYWRLLGDNQTHEEPKFSCEPHLYRIYPEDRHLIAELGQEVGATDWNDWFETWAKARGMTMQLTADGRFMCPDTSLAQKAHEAGCMASHMYYMELCRQEEQAKTSPAHTSEARDAALVDELVQASLALQMAKALTSLPLKNEFAKRNGMASHYEVEAWMLNAHRRFDAALAAMRKEAE